MIRLERTDTGIALQSPYHEDFVRGARSLGGKWDKPFWHFDARDTARVEQLLSDIYGWTRPLDDEPLVTLHLTVGNSPWSQPAGPLMIAGIVVAQAYGPDSPARPGDGVVIVDGSAAGSGNKDNWRTAATPGTVFELRDIPQSQANTIVTAALDRRIGTACIVDAPNTTPRQAAIAQIRTLMIRHGIDPSEL